MSDKFKFTDALTGEPMGECAATPGALLRSKLALFGGGEPSNQVESIAQVFLWGYMSAKACGNPVVEIPKRITVEGVTELMDKVNVEYLPAGESDSEPVDENPTGTPGVRS